MLGTITIDIGTTSVKLCLFRPDGGLALVRRAATPTVNDEFGEIYDAAELLSVIHSFIRQLEPQQRESVQRIAITGVGESGGLVDEDIALVSPMVLWHDQRGTEYLAKLSKEQRARVYRVTGLPVNGNYGISKTAWTANRAGDAAEASYWLNIAEYVAATMTGTRWSELSLASRTMALDLTSKTWSDEVCQDFGLHTSNFPPLAPAKIGHEITPAFAAEVGLNPETRVHVAGHDHMVGAVGASLQPGELLNSTGTTEGLLMLRDQPRLDKDAENAKLANGISCTGDHYTLFASIPTGGSAFATLQKLLDTTAITLNGVLEDLHEKYVSGVIDLDHIPLVLPQFRGSPPPTKNSGATAVISGLGNNSTMEQLVFGTFLGMVAQFRDVLALFDEPVDRVKVIGPASGNMLWLQLKADYLGVPLAVSRFPEVVSRGAQVLASGSPISWYENDVFEIHPNLERHTQLMKWRADNSAKWEYMKGFPA